MNFILLWSCSSPAPTTVSFDNEMISFSQSTFDMGIADIDVGPYGNSWKETAQPQHEVTLSPFMLDKTEVPIWQYVAFLNAIEQDNRGSALAHHHSLQPITWEDGEFVADTTLQNLPINYVSFYDALTFCTWRGSSLPTEAMWERAAKGADRENPRNFPWTEGRATCQNSVFYTNATLCAEHPQEVGTHLLGATPEGVLDMAGNVSEWVWDWYDRYAETTVTDPKGPDTGKYKILRGGGFRETSDALRVTDRVSANPLSRSEGIGFRCGHEEQP